MRVSEKPKVIRRGNHIFSFDNSKKTQTGLHRSLGKLAVSQESEHRDFTWRDAAIVCKKAAGL